MHAARRVGRVCCRRALLAALCLPFIGFAQAAPGWAAAHAAASAAPAGEKPAVAVLRFQVHSSKPLDYLGESLANLMRTRSRRAARCACSPASATPDGLADEGAGAATPSA